MRKFSLFLGDEPDDESKRLPEPMIAALDGVSAPDNEMTEQSAELELRRTQVDDLYNQWQQQTTAVEIASHENNRQRETIAALQTAMRQRESDTEDAAAEQQLSQSDNERRALRTQLDKALRESAELSRRLLAAEIALNNRAIAVTSARERFEQPTAAPATALEEKIRLAAAIEDANRRHRNELAKQTEHFENRFKQIKAVVEQRDMQIKDLEQARLEIAARCDDLAKTVGALEAARHYTQEKFESQAKLVELLESLLRAEREVEKLKIAELTAELDRERLAHAATQRATEAIRKDIGLLLPKLAVRGYRPEGSATDPALAHKNAA